MFFFERGKVYPCMVAGLQILSRKFLVSFGVKFLKQKNGNHNILGVEPIYQNLRLRAIPITWEFVRFIA
jgi:hypothetical protein